MRLHKTATFIAAGILCGTLSAGVFAPHAFAKDGLRFDSEFLKLKSSLSAQRERNDAPRASSSAQHGTQTASTSGEDVSASTSVSAKNEDASSTQPPTLPAATTAPSTSSPASSSASDAEHANEQATSSSSASTTATSSAAAPSTGASGGPVQPLNASAGANVYASSGSLSPWATVELLVLSLALGGLGYLFAQGDALANLYRAFADAIGVKPIRTVRSRHV